MKMLLAESLRQVGLNQEEIDQALQHIENQRLRVLNRKPAYEVLGKKEGISKLTGIFHDVVLRNETLKPLLNREILARMRQRQESFFCKILGAEEHDEGW